MTIRLAQGQHKLCVGTKQFRDNRKQMMRSILQRSFATGTGCSRSVVGSSRNSINCGDCRLEATGADQGSPQRQSHRGHHEGRVYANGARRLAHSYANIFVRYPREGNSQPKQRSERRVSKQLNVSMVLEQWQLFPKQLNFRGYNCSMLGLYA